MRFDNKTGVGEIRDSGVCLAPGDQLQRLRDRRGIKQVDLWILAREFCHRHIIPGPGHRFSIEIIHRPQKRLVAPGDDPHRKRLVRRGEMKTLLSFRRASRADKHVDLSAFRIRISPRPIGIVDRLEFQPDALGDELEDIRIDAAEFARVLLKTKGWPIRVVTHPDSRMRFNPSTFARRNDHGRISWWNNFFAGEDKGRGKKGEPDSKPAKCSAKMESDFHSATGILTHDFGVASLPW